MRTEKPVILEHIRPIARMLVTSESGCNAKRRAVGPGPEVLPAAAGSAAGRRKVLLHRWPMAASMPGATNATPDRRPTMIVRVLLCLVLLAAIPAHAQEGARQRSHIVIPEGSEATYDKWGFAPAIRTEDGTIYVSGVIAGLAGDGSYEERYARGFRHALEAIGRILAAAGASLDDVVEIMSFHTDLARQLETAVAVRKEIMNPPHPAWTAVGTPALASPFGETEIRVVAKLPATAG
ncbi:MAG: hypothetical protein D6807_08665 [Alphaproteobacteria bacterium]|nr:MAG: hypothetical protein D6807_08665 [Alphaproteobacteria bacterium]